jgi:antitoxin Phd
VPIDGCFAARNGLSLIEINSRKEKDTADGSRFTRNIKEALIIALGWGCSHRQPRDRLGLRLAITPNSGLDEAWPFGQSIYLSSQTSHYGWDMPKRSRKHKQQAAQKTGTLKALGSSWQIQTAKARFSEVFRRTRSEGPQFITRQGKEGVVMISDEQYDQLVSRSHQPKSIVQFFRESPLVGVELNLERDKDEGRDIEL